MKQWPFKNPKTFKVILNLIKKKTSLLLAVLFRKVISEIKYGKI